MWVPAHRFLALLDRCRVTSDELYPAADKRVRELRSGRQEFLSLNVADRILTSLNLNHWLHLPKEHGGLADIYEDGVQYGAPNYSHTKRPRPAARKYATEEERRAARRQTYRDHYYRRKTREATT